MSPNRPQIADVAREAGVSIATVSRVLSGNTPVAPDTAERVRSAVETLNYVPHAAARILASRRTDTLGLLVPEISGAFFQPLLRGIEAGASEAGLDLLIHATQTIPVKARHHTLGEHNTDGLLVFTESLDEKELSRLNAIGFPLVLLHQTPPSSLNIPVVTIENRAGARALVEHLITRHDRRRIAFLRGPEGQEDSTLRERGYREALEAHHLPFDPALVVRGEFDRMVAFESVNTLLSTGMQIDAIFSGDDEAAVGALQALLQAGRRVPEEIAVAGFDDQVLAGSLTPPLTTVRAPTEEVGRQAVQILVRLIKQEEVVSRLILPTELVIRQSCGCPARL
jgi:LacI family transcriptional regulator